MNRQTNHLTGLMKPKVPQLTQAAGAGTARRSGGRGIGEVIEGLRLLTISD